MSLAALFTDMKLAEHRLNNLERRIEDGIRSTSDIQNHLSSSNKLPCGSRHGNIDAAGKRQDEGGGS